MAHFKKEPNWDTFASPDLNLVEKYWYKFARYVFLVHFHVSFEKQDVCRGWDSPKLESPFIQTQIGILTVFNTDNSIFYRLSMNLNYVGFKDTS